MVQKFKMNEGAPEMQSFLDRKEGLLWGSQQNKWPECLVSKDKLP